MSIETPYASAPPDKSRITQEDFQTIKETYQGLSGNIVHVTWPAADTQAAMAFVIQAVCGEEARGRVVHNPYTGKFIMFLELTDEDRRRFPVWSGVDKVWIGTKAPEDCWADEGKGMN